jgi:NAD(P)-dependent dehydrogenase (short-subunit alcohol dehydrogenase family)
MNLQLQDRVALVTGASEGIGGGYGQGICSAGRYRGGYRPS